MRIKGDTNELPLEKTLTNSQRSIFARVAELTARKICEPGAHVREEFSLDASGESVPIFSKASVQRDVLGWMLEYALIELEDRTPRKVVAYRATDHIGLRYLELAGRSMIEMNDNAEPADVAQILYQVAGSFRRESLRKVEPQSLGREPTPRSERSKFSANYRK